MFWSQTGKFSIPGKNFLRSTHEFDIDVRDASTILSAVLYSDSNGNVEGRELDLDEFLTNEDGEFKWNGRGVFWGGQNIDVGVSDRDGKH
jgi:hypothetical protein